MFATSVLAGLVLVGTGFSTSDWWVEQWCVWKLGSDSFPDRFRAAEKLGELRSTKAIPKLVALLQEVPEHLDAAREVWGIRSPPGSRMGDVWKAIGSPAVPALAEALRDSRDQPGYWRRLACYSLWETGDDAAVEPLMELLDDRYTCLRLVAIRALGEMGPAARRAIPALEAAAVREKGTLRSAVDSAIHRIRESVADKLPGRN